MKKILMILTAIVFIANSHGAGLGFDPAHTRIGFLVRHLMVSDVYGNFREFSGKFDFDEKKSLLKSAEVKIKAASIDTSHPKRDEHLRSPDFFEVSKFPEITFVADGNTVLPLKKKTAVNGALTIRGITEKVKLNFTYLGTKKDPWGNVHHAFQADAEINRLDFGLKWNKALEAGGVLVGETVKIQIEGQLIPGK